MIILGNKKLFTLYPHTCYHIINKGGSQMSYKVSIVIEKDEYGYYAYSPELEGCQTQGDSLEDVIANAKEAVELYLETLSREEIKELLSKEILTTTVEVQVA
jgi:predicted RNase H-like HicB family nuclease